MLSLSLSLLPLLLLLMRFSFCVFVQLNSRKRTSGTTFITLSPSERQFPLQKQTCLCVCVCFHKTKGTNTLEYDCQKKTNRNNGWALLCIRITLGGIWMCVCVCPLVFWCDRYVRFANHILFIPINFRQTNHGPMSEHIKCTCVRLAIEIHHLCACVSDCANLLR